ncbi:MAG: histidine phosphatase family protein [Chloroflexi bacterium]|nr:histidine phosphatase family protein [Chloroflexota bacterium]
MRLILARHGETNWNRERRMMGRTDLPLTTHGQEQAQALGRALGGVTIRAVYASPLRRAMETAQAVARPHALTVTPLDGLMELDAGELDGLTPAEARIGHRPFLEQWSQGDPNLAAPGGESLGQVQERAWAVLDSLMECHRSDTIVLVSHHFVLVTLTCRALGIPLQNFRRLRSSVAGYSILDFSGPEATLVVLNDTCHLSRASG